MENKTYYEQLKDPRWQKKRLEKNRMIWEYEWGELITLCKQCHEKKHDYIDSCNSILCRMANDRLENIVLILRRLSELNNNDIDQIRYNLKDYGIFSNSNSDDLSF
jgi:hypothetical protein